MVPMMDILTALEASAFSTWLRESSTVWAYPTVLTLHTVGLAVLVGASWAVDLRVLGFAEGIPLAALERAFPAMWIGFWVNAISGALLFAADATTKGTTLLFMSKLGLVGVGVATIVMIRRTVYGHGEPRLGMAAKALAVASLVVWIAAIAAGRWMAYI
jgi:hypothetical protein